MPCLLWPTRIFLSTSTWLYLEQGFLSLSSVSSSVATCSGTDLAYFHLPLTFCLFCPVFILLSLPTTSEFSMTVDLGTVSWTGIVFVCVWKHQDQVSLRWDLKGPAIALLLLLWALSLAHTNPEQALFPLSWSTSQLKQSSADPYHYLFVPETILGSRQ